MQHTNVPTPASPINKSSPVTPNVANNVYELMRQQMVKHEASVLTQSNKQPFNQASKQNNNRSPSYQKHPTEPYMPRRMDWLPPRARAALAKINKQQENAAQHRFRSKQNRHLRGQTTQKQQQEGTPTAHEQDWVNTYLYHGVREHHMLRIVPNVVVVLVYFLW